MKLAAQDSALHLTRPIWVLLLLIVLAVPVRAAAPPAAPLDQSAKVHELLDLLNDPEVQAWIKTHAGSRAAEGGAPADIGVKLEDRLSARFGAIRDHLTRLIQVIPKLPAEFGRAYESLSREREGRSPLAILVYLAAFLLLGFSVEWLYLRATARLRLRVRDMTAESVAQRLGAIAANLGYRLVAIGVFGLASLGVFLIFDWPPLLREILFKYLLALLGLRLALVVCGCLLGSAHAEKETSERLRILPMSDAAADFWRRRLALPIAWIAFGYVTVGCLDALGFDPEARRLVAYLLGLGLLAMALEILWHRPSGGVSAAGRRRLVSWLFSAYFVAVWLLWVSSAMSLMWLLVMIALVPWAIGRAQRAVTHLLQPPGSAVASPAPSFLDVSLKRGLRALIIVAGALFLIHAWDIDFVALTTGDTFFTQLVRGLLSSVVIIMVADFGWHLARTAIDRKIMEAPDSEDPSSEQWQRQARLRTLLPILRNLLLVVLLVMVGLMVLASVGVNVGPLIAGASVVGVAIGFGAQTLVRDIISGMFYLLDDAFRVGEYIQSGNFKGTVESFSLRSVKLRHHRGPVFTVPFGVLGAVQNMSRDWVIDKLSVGVTYDTDLGKVKKIVKDIGKQLLQDPELKPKILETLKMQGVEQFGDYAIQIRMKMMTKPGEQFVIRRRANALIKLAFDENGIEFAFPTVQVAGSEGSSAEAASAAQHVLQKTAVQQ